MADRQATKLKEDRARLDDAIDELTQLRSEVAARLNSSTEA